MIFVPVAPGVVEVHLREVVALESNRTKLSVSPGASDLGISTSERSGSCSSSSSAMVCQSSSASSFQSFKVHDRHRSRSSISSISSACSAFTSASILRERSLCS